MSCFCSEWGKFHVSSCTCPLLSFADREPENQREKRGRQREKISIPLAASVPFSLSGVGNLPRNVTESINSFLPLITSAHHITANISPIKSTGSARIVAVVAFYSIKLPIFNTLLPETDV